MARIIVDSRRWMARIVAVLMLALPGAAFAQVVVVANGSPITEYDIQQRTKLETSATHKPPTRQQVINDLIDDRLKISRAKVYGLEVSEAEIDSAFENMATRQHVTVAQFSQVLERAGISPNTVKTRIRAELTWQQLIRGKFGASLQVGDSDIANALKGRNDPDVPAVGYIYTLYPVMIVVPSGSSEVYHFRKAHRGRKPAQPICVVQRGPDTRARIARRCRSRADYPELRRPDAAVARSARQHADRASDRA